MINKILDIVLLENIFNLLEGEPCFFVCKLEIDIPPESQDSFDSIYFSYESIYICHMKVVFNYIQLKSMKRWREY